MCNRPRNNAVCKAECNVMDTINFFLHNFLDIIKLMREMITAVVMRNLSRGASERSEFSRCRHA